ncbi:hypothetical protein ACHAXR_007617 [Thalassiosira sp. AJA248-18]
MSTSKGNDDGDYVAVENAGVGGTMPEIEREDGAPSDNDDTSGVTPVQRLQTTFLGLLSALPTLLLIGFGAKASVLDVWIYIALLQSTSIFIYNDIESGVARWVIGFILLMTISSFKSGQLLASCDDMTVKGVLYAITALWECSNAVLVIGGKKLKERFGINCPRDIILYTLAPCQVKFIPATQNFTVVDVCRRNCAPSGQMGKRSIHIALCILGVSTLYALLANVQPVQSFVTSFVLIELECLAFMASMAVVALDIPSHVWQIIHNLLAPTPPVALALSNGHALTTPKVILPYGWVYSSSSTREFWSRWSRPATQLIRHLLYYPLGGRDRWYISIPIMFLLNASSHFDLSYALVGDKAEVYWLALFGTLAAVAILEVVGDSWCARVNGDGNASFPSWYLYGKMFLAHASLRLVLYIMIHLCLKTSLGKILGIDNDGA